MSTTPKGPVLSCALRRLASICRSEVIGLPASNWVRFVIWTAGRGIVRSEPGTIHRPFKLVRAARGDTFRARQRRQAVHQDLSLPCRCSSR
jgi:hypothetical protein